MELYFLIAGSINAATDFVLLALVSERWDGCNAQEQETNEATTSVADTDSLASEDQPGAETRPDWNFHRGPHVSLPVLHPLHSPTNFIYLTTQPAYAQSV